MILSVGTKVLESVAMAVRTASRKSSGLLWTSKKTLAIHPTGGKKAEKLPHSAASAYGVTPIKVSLGSTLTPLPLHFPVRKEMHNGMKK